MMCCGLSFIAHPLDFCVRERIVCCSSSRPINARLGCPWCTAGPGKVFMIACTHAGALIVFLLYDNLQRT